MELSIEDLAEAVADAIKADTSPNKEWEEYTPIKTSKDSMLMEVYLSEPVHAPAMYNRLCHELRNRPEGSKTILYLNNGGGVEISSVAIVAAINESKGTTVAHLSGMVASASTVITMACDEIVVTPNLMFMVHESSFEGLGGKFSDMKTFNTFFDKYTKDMSYDIYKGFLTDDEIETMHNGKEYWLNSREVLERWNNKINI